MSSDPALLPSLSPLAAAARLAGRRGRVVLHSARDDDGLGRCSFVTAEPSATLIARGHSLVVLDPGGRPAKRFTGDPLDAAEAFLAEHGCTLEPRAAGAPEPRVIGYLGYDLARIVERLPGRSATGQAGPDLWLAAYGAVARWSSGHYEIIGPDRDARTRLADALARPARPSLPPAFGPFIADDDASHHMARIDRVRDYLAAGDVYQVNLARRLVARYTAPGDLLAVYAALAAVAPAPYGALIEADGTTLISGSPERFLASVGDRVETRPIKGTCAPGDDAAAALAASSKDAAEHLMIVDLERNDLGRIAETGSVSVDALGYIVELPALYHKVSRVSAKPRPGIGYAALFRATFPGGSITGAPKVRAMQLIDELEPVRRGPYCGAIGYFGAHGAFDLALAIRTGVVLRDELRVHVGGGIVADSDAEAELAETELKALGWVAALDRLRAAPHPLP
ncbi:MAG TPA: anthranilate synthase component I family protein [Kofleriaceae bacterium]|jgi:para-aminobenzoate synthetase component 1|nr:anthranilate synthase component I family protein [Kofleriaceae bacterium]